ncbi:ribosome-inactivating protein cucurmosin-like [Humulus lupulus]|uniref:ribosome-inactivating protein cucurmosin-like n=1 Tax=Humulus lupulus TaxID=3486 RepID=UPI002B411029|nr:ribosome-inactivating protein cucurmosin-like [Humulus lupulus]
MKGGSNNMIVQIIMVALATMSTPLTATFSTVSFNTKFEGASVGPYYSFMSSLRTALSSGAESYGIRVLRTKAAAVGDKQFVYVRLYNPSTVSITFALDALNSYVVAYQVDAEKRCYFFREAPPNSRAVLFNQCTNKVDVNLVTSYGNLGNREKTRLGFKPLDQSLEAFRRFDSRDPTNELRQNLLVVIQMVAEAGRFKYIQQKLEQKGFGSGFLPGGDIISFENNWDALSTAIQQSKDGKFTPIQLKKEDNTLRVVSTVAEVKDDMGLLLNAGTTTMMSSEESFEEIAASY